MGNGWPHKEKEQQGSRARGKPASKRAARREMSAKKSMELIISKSRTKAAAKINVSGDFYHALDQAVRRLIEGAEERAAANHRKTIRPEDL